VSRVGVIVPYRDRKEQLHRFIDHTSKYLSNRNFDYFIIVVEQLDNKEFNRGKLLNVGFKEARKKRCDYVVFHDVDMLAEKVDYSFSEIPMHLASDRLPFDHYFGGITLFPVDYFEKINGFSNVYWGWGFEDDDLRYRCIEKDVPLVRVTQTDRNPPRTDLKLNGVDAFVSSKNVLDVTKSFSVGIKFTPEKQIYDHQKDSDKFTLFNIPEYDFSINYTSFNRYQVEFFNTRLEYNHIFSNIEAITPTTHSIFITYNALNKVLKFYLNKKLVGEQKLSIPFYKYNEQPKLYLGSKEGKQDYFKGTIKEFYIFNKNLKNTEVKELHLNQSFGATQNFGSYKSSSYLQLYYDTRFIKDYKLIDLSLNNNFGSIENCEIVEPTPITKFFDYIPYRRYSKIHYLDHDNNGFEDGKWKNKSTRWNQLRYNNEVSTGYYDVKKDGLSNLTYTLLENKKENRVIYLKVEL